ncbi:unnamed protein product [Thelazia callipaeda]|uniref:Disintegrin and metalloproteinase domain-containing protein 28 n=1 Tax=Thelazia callipaeda TaxID=103827 RepID=A0A0N5D000_THECL|nr:unnamed protein product [Thelazia callipaeda]
MHNDIRCPLKIFHQEREINVNELISVSLKKQSGFELTLKNDAGQTWVVPFQTNQELSTIPNKANISCHFNGVSRSNEQSAMSTCSNSLFGQVIYWNSKKKRSISASYDYYSDYLDRRWRYVELALIADHLVLYVPLNIRVILVWADIWMDNNSIDISSSSDKTLWNFLNWRKRFIKDHPHDNAQLLTGIVFDNNVVGKAFKGTMCSYDFSGGVNMDHSTQAQYVAATIAHEMGHNFGMEHDIDEAECRCPAESCIMSSATGIKPPTFWSECSLRTLQHSLSRGVDYCLRNSPESVFGGARCGNGIVEAGEECDCGTPNACINKCCNPATCKLVETADCASGECCDLNTCQMLPASTVCRQPTNECDLPEYCDGQMEHCPADFYVQDGHKCPDHVDDYCYNGYCGSRDAQCEYIWGMTGKNAAAECYDLNFYGSSGGNCGFVHETNRFIPCHKSNVKCGRLHCTHENEKLAFGDPSTVYTAYTGLRLTNNEDVACRVVWTKYVGGKKKPDPGMVPDGASCGQDKMCVDAECSNRTAKVLMAPKCDPISCNNAGICNNMGNCHCVPGYGGPSCAIPGPGGSVNSGPAVEGGVVHVGFVAFWFLLVLGIAFIGASIVVKRKKDFWLHKEIWGKLKKVLRIEKLLVPIRKAPPPPRPAIRTSDLNNLWGDQLDLAQVRYNQQPLPPSISLPVVSPENLNSLPWKSNITSRNSMRPTVAPPRVPQRPQSDALEAFYTGKGAEVGIIPAASTTPSYYVPTESCTSKISKFGSFRPEQAPPPPPHRNQAANNARSDDKIKPVLPAKPLIVKDLASRFDPKLSQVSAKFI